MNKFQDNKYYIASNIVRYINYQYETKKEIEEVISEVNTNRDYDEYSLLNKANLKLDNLVLVNKYYYLDSNYSPDDLVLIDKKYSVKGSIRKDVNDKFVNMCEDALKENLHIINASPFRSYSRQKELYKNEYKIKKELADRSIARPGYSEHQTGLAMDYRNLEVDIDEFEDTDEFRWLINNSYKYGFILRYPKGKENITGYKYEPWHFRYVGEEVAKYIYENDITFDEYYAYYIEKK